MSSMLAGFTASKISGVDNTFMTMVVIISENSRDPSNTPIFVNSSLLDMASIFVFFML